MVQPAREQASDIRARADQLQASMMASRNGHEPPAAEAAPPPASNGGDQPTAASPPAASAPAPQPAPAPQGPAQPPAAAPIPAPQPPPPPPAPQPQPAAAPAEPQTDWKALYEQERARVHAQADNWVKMRSEMQAAQNRAAQIEAEIARLRTSQQPQGGPPPASGYGGPEFQVPGWHPTQAPAPQAQPQPQQQPTPFQAPTPEMVKAAREYLTQELGETVVQRNEQLVQAMAAQISQQMAAQVSTDVMNRVNATFAPYLQEMDSIRGVVAQQQQREVMSENQRFHNEMAKAGHEDWEQVLGDPEFQAFVRSHPYGVHLWGDLYPDPGQPSGTSGVHINAITEFKQSRPGYRAQQEQTAEAERRRAAAAESAQVPLHGAASDAGGQPQQIRMSEIQRKTQELASKPNELRAFRDQVNAAMAAGQFIDDVNVSYGSPAVP